MLGRRERAQARAARHQPSLGVLVQDRDDAAQVVEDVDPRAGLEERERADDDPAADEQAEDPVDVPPRADDAGDHVVDDHEADEERQRLDHVGLQPLLADAGRVRSDRADQRQEQRDHGTVERGAPQPDPRVDQQRGDPDRRDHGDQEPVRLELERQRARQRVAADRDEHDDEDQPGDLRLPGQQSLAEAVRDRPHGHQSTGMSPIRACPSPRTPPRPRPPRRCRPPGRPPRGGR